MNSYPNVWSLPSLSEMSDEERGAFYDELASDAEGSNFLSSKNADCWESVDWRVGVICNDGKIISACGLTEADLTNGGITPVKPETRIDVYLDKVYVYQMPCEKFIAQLLIESTHLFDDDTSCDVGYCVTANGRNKSALEFPGDICISNLKIGNHLSLKLATNLLADKSSEKIIHFLNTELVNQGLKVTSLYDPAFSTILSYLNAATIALLERNKNKVISKLPLTFYTSPGPTVNSLVQASYIFLQNWEYPDSPFSWNKFRWSSDAGQLLEHGELCKANYYVMRLKPCEDW